MRSFDGLGLCVTDLVFGGLDLILWFDFSVVDFVLGLPVSFEVYFR